MDPIDEYLGKWLKNWAAVRRPPANGKARLLSAAAQMMHSRPHEIHKLPATPDPFFVRIFNIKPNHDRHWDHTPPIVDWTLVYPFELSLVNMRHIL